MPDNREHLRAAIAAVETAETEHSKTVAAHQRSRTMLEAAEAEVKSFSDLESAIFQHVALSQITYAGRITYLEKCASSLFIKGSFHCRRADTNNVSMTIIARV